MTRDEILTKLIEVIRQETAYTGEITDETRLIDDIGADSLRLEGIVTSAETTFDIGIPDEVLFEMERVGDAVDFVEKTLTR
jgi:acyl carrier protein